MECCSKMGFVPISRDVFVTFSGTSHAKRMFFFSIVVFWAGEDENNGCFNGDKIETKWRQNGDNMEIKWRQNGDEMETKWRQKGDNNLDKYEDKMFTFTR